MRKRFILAALVLATLAGVAADAAVYVVVLKNGQRIVAREKFQVKGPNALITTKTGTLTAIPLSQIDLVATEKVNAQGLGDAIALDWVDAEGNRTRPTPSPTKSVTEIGRLRTDAGEAERETRPTPTPGIMFRDKAFGDARVDRAFQEALERSHLYLYRTGIGTDPTYLFIEVSVNGQPEVLKALEAISLAYHLLAQQAPERIPPKVEIQLVNEAGKEAGLFRITAEDAMQLATGKVASEDFFVQKVIF